MSEQSKCKCGIAWMLAEHRAIHQLSPASPPPAASKPHETAEAIEALRPDLGSSESFKDGFWACRRMAAAIVAEGATKEQVEKRMGVASPAGGTLAEAIREIVLYTKRCHLDHPAHEGSFEECEWSGCKLAKKLAFAAPQPQPPAPIDHLSDRIDMLAETSVSSPAASPPAASECQHDLIEPENQKLRDDGWLRCTKCGKWKHLAAEAQWCPKCRHLSNNQGDCVRCTCDHQKSAAPSPAGGTLAEVLLEAESSFQSEISWYENARDGFSPGTPNWSVMDEVVRRYRTLKESAAALAAAQPPPPAQPCPDVRCLFCGDPAIGVYWMSKGCACRTERSQALCAQHAGKSLPCGEMVQLWSALPVQPPPPAEGWVSVKDRLPDLHKQVIFFSDYRDNGGGTTQVMGYLEALPDGVFDACWRQDGSDLQKRNVTHWRLLPASPPPPVQACVDESRWAKGPVRCPAPPPAETQHD